MERKDVWVWGRGRTQREGENPWGMGGHQENTWRQGTLGEEGGHLEEGGKTPAGG
jgi:hypothetical protein